MKLLFCPACFDVFKLDYEKRECKCGNVKGMYLNNTQAVSNGRGYSLAIGNGSLQMAIYQMESFKDSSDEAERSEYYQAGQGLISHAWVRPNEGSGNPHMKVDEDL